MNLPGDQVSAVPDTDDIINPQIDFARYGLVINPFSLSPDPRFMYLSPAMRSALMRITFAIQNRQGICAIVGEVGVGKTTLAGWLEDTYRRQVKFVTAYIEDPPQGQRSQLPLARRIAAELGLSQRRSIEEQLDDLRGALAEIQNRGQNALLIIDEAQGLRTPQFALLRQILNFESRHEGKLFQIVILGPPQLERRLERFPPLHSRVAMSVRLETLSPEDTREMIRFRLQVAGRRERLFSDEALQAVYLGSRGLPRDIIRLAGEMLIQAYMENQPLIDGRLAHAVLAQHRPQTMVEG